MLELSLVSGKVFREEGLGGTETLEGLAWVTEGGPTALADGDDDVSATLWYSSGLSLTAMRRDAATYTWSKVDEISAVLMTDMYCDACDLLTSNVAGLAN